MNIAGLAQTIQDIVGIRRRLQLLLITEATHQLQRDAQHYICRREDLASIDGAKKKIDELDAQLVDDKTLIESTRRLLRRFEERHGILCRILAVCISEKIPSTSQS